jgi:RNA polymerase sigma factor (sigma-70 family)
MEKILAHNYQKNRTGLLNYIKSRISRIEEAEDILQDVYLQAMKSLNVAEPVENLFGWLFTVANNKIIDWYRKKNTKDFGDQENYNLREILNVDDNFVLDDHTRQTFSATILNAIDSLALPQKNVFIMHHIEEKTFREIAAIENVSINTVLARNQYAIKNLRKKLSVLK